VLLHGKIFTADDAKPWAQAVASRGELFVAVGGDAEIRAIAGPSTRVIDLAGRTVVPGINDAHLHQPFGADIKPIALPRDATAEQVLAAVADAAKQAAPGTWIRATIGPNVLDDPRLTAEALDRIAPSNPVRLTTDAGHAALFNRGIGWLYENDLWKYERKETEAETDLVQRMQTFADQAIRYGITSVQTMPSLSGAAARALARRLDVPLRIRWIQFNIGTIEEHPAMPQKYVLDGTPVERGAAIREGYADRPGSFGRMNYTDDELRRILEIAARGDQPLLLHIAGDAALEKVFAIMRTIPADWPALRVRIEHGDFIDRFVDDAKRFGVIVVQNPAHFTLGDVARARYGAAAMGNFMPMRSLIARGIPAAIGSDGPLNPWLNVMFATIHPANPPEAITREQAIVAYTRGSAFAEFAEKEKGTIAPGKLADLAVLSQDVFAVPPPELPKTVSVMTIVGGKVIYAAARQPGATD